MNNLFGIMIIHFLLILSVCKIQKKNEIDTNLMGTNLQEIEEF